MLFRFLFLFIIVCSCGYTQSSSVNDVMFLIDLGIKESDIIKHIENSQNAPLSNEDVEFLKEKGVPSTIIEALQNQEALSSHSILQMVNEGTTERDIIKKINEEENIAKYGVEDWLLLHRNKISPEIIRSLKEKLSLKKKQITLEDVQKWHSDGMSTEDILAKLKQGDIDMKTVSTLSLLKMKGAGFPREIIHFLAEKHLNPENKPVAEVTLSENKEQSLVENKEEQLVENKESKFVEETTEEKPKEDTYKFVSPNNPEAYVKIPPKTENIKLPVLGEDQNPLAIIKRSFYCSLFSSSEDIAKVELFYRKNYSNIQVARIGFNDVVNILKIKFPIVGLSKLMEIRYYAIDTKKLSYLKNIEKIQQKITKNNYSVKKLVDEIDTQNYLHKIGNISLEEKNKKVKKYQSKLNLIANTSLYWDYKAIEHVLKYKKNMLLALQPNVPYTGSKLPSTTIDKISTVELQPETIETLAKDFPTVVFPKSQMVSHHKIDEGLRRTSKQRSIYRSLFLCDATTDEIEKYYRKYHKNASVWRVHYLDSFQIIKAKFEIPQIRSKAEVAFYVLTISPKSTRWESKHNRIKERLRKLERAVKNIDNEMNQLQNLLVLKKISKSSAEQRIKKLKKEKYLKLNTSSYWDFTVMDRVMKSQRSILLVTETKHHY